MIARDGRGYELEKRVVLAADEREVARHGNSKPGQKGESGQHRMRLGHEQPGGPWRQTGQPSQAGFDLRETAVMTKHNGPRAVRTAGGGERIARGGVGSGPGLLEQDRRALVPCRDEPGGGVLGNRRMVVLDRRQRDARESRTDQDHRQATPGKPRLHRQRARKKHPRRLRMSAGELREMGGRPAPVVPAALDNHELEISVLQLRPQLSDPAADRRPQAPESAVAVHWNGPARRLWGLT